MMEIVWMYTTYEVTLCAYYVVNVVEKDLNMGDHGYARRQPLVDSEEDVVQRTDEVRPCSLCQHYKTKLEQQQQHTARLQREVTFILRNHQRLYLLAI